MSVNVDLVGVIFHAFQMCEKFVECSVIVLDSNEDVDRFLKVRIEQPRRPILSAISKKDKPILTTDRPFPVIERGDGWSRELDFWLDSEVGSNYCYVDHFHMI